MTDKENETGATPAGGSKVVMVEQSTVSSHKPYRPTDLQDDASGELHNKRSRAPAVPSVAEEFKDSPESAEIKEQLETTKEGEREMSVDKITNIDTKVSSSISKKRPSTPEAIPLTPIEVEVKKTEIIATPALHPMQPIPVGLGSKASEISELPDKKETEGKDEEDSITAEIAELRTPDPTQKSAEWDNENCRQNNVTETQETEGAVPLQRKLASETISKSVNELEKKDISENNSIHIQYIERNSERKSKSETVNQYITSTHDLKRKQISWNDSTYLDKVQIQDLNTETRNTRSAWELERQASIGPCYKKTLPFGEPSGISIFLPKKSSKSIKENVTFVKSGISLILSKKNFEAMEFDIPKDHAKNSRRKSNIEFKVDEGHCDIFGNIKGKLEYLRGKIKHALHM
ncbi:uncharacterized protein LOC118269325 isoform X1 [Spodoptera frugiperda]|uniref:Uncharacterized protein LOC118269325 isoform X1 n=1 Tax=Spodoptera frugiperda TaxID=7108 RepID=A0A9R0D4S1_SPOFR|nr:uncharacterized protein LOC118269325 isoform X1 [Spodoptera frugiperda]